MVLTTLGRPGAGPNGRLPLCARRIFSRYSEKARRANSALVRRWSGGPAGWSIAFSISSAIHWGMLKVRVTARSRSSRLLRFGMGTHNPARTGPRQAKLHVDIIAVPRHLQTSSLNIIKSRYQTFCYITLYQARSESRPTRWHCKPLSLSVLPTGAGTGHPRRGRPMSGRRWFCTARGFELIPTQANTSGSASGPWCVEVESLAAEPNAPFVTLARASRADVWH